MSDLPPAPVPQNKSGLGQTLAILAGFGLVVAIAVGVMAVIFGRSEPKPAKPVAVAFKGDVAAGRLVTMKNGCVTCHSDDGTIVRGPSYKGLFNSTVTYTDGETGVVDEADVRDQLIRPTSKVIEGFEPIMPPAKNLTPADVDNLIAYLHSIGAKP